MKKECQRTMQSLPKYLHGHVFAINRARIERHLSQCVVCRSEYEGLRRAEETRQILNHINVPEGIIGRIKARVMTLGKLKKVFYRPLWISGIMLIAAAVYYFAVTPKQLDVEIERIVKTAPSSSMAGNSPVLPTVSATASLSHIPTQRHVATVPIATPEPLVVILIPEDNTLAIRKINDIMHGYSTMHKKKFSKNIREISASLTTRELSVLFNRIEPLAKISYNQQQFNSFPTTTPVPFVLKLKAAPKLAEDHMPLRAEQAVTSGAPASSLAEQPTTSGAEVPPSSPADH